MLYDAHEGTCLSCARIQHKGFFLTWQGQGMGHPAGSVKTQ